MKNMDHISNVITYIEEHLNEDIDLETIAEALFYSKYHLHRMFTSTTGLTIHDYMQRRRLSEAAKLLIFSERSILEIALIAGYESQQAFTSIFKEMYKQTPYQYRKHGTYYPLLLRYTLHMNKNTTLSIDEITSRIRLAALDDISAWMNLVHLVIDGFPCLDERSHIVQLTQEIKENRAYIWMEDDIAAAVMSLHKSTGSIDFLGIHPQYPKKETARAFLNFAFTLIPLTTLHITTFRENDRADMGYRQLWKDLGFAQAELLTEFGYPTQRMILHKGDNDE